MSAPWCSLPHLLFIALDFPDFDRIQPFTRVLSDNVVNFGMSSCYVWLPATHIGTQVALKIAFSF